MKLSLTQIAALVLGVIAYVALCYFADKTLPQRFRAYFRYGVVGFAISVFFYAMQELVPNHRDGVHISKAAVAITAALAVFYEQYRQSIQRPIAVRWKKFVAVALALSAITLYFNAYKFGYPKYYHRWDQYHYYMGAKYFPELGFKKLYHCAVAAQDELGKVPYKLDRPHGSDRAPSVRNVDMRKEMRDPDKKIRDLAGENLLVPVKKIIANPEECSSLFSAERWEEYKRDVAFFRIVSGKGYWTDMQKDHGFNPPPVWTIGGKFFADLHVGSVAYLQFLASLDIVYLLGMFVALWWGFGWRVFAVGAIFWGCQSSAPFYWTGGAFLRQDWLFFSVLSVACIRKKYFKIAGASLVYAGLLRIFPGLVVFGTLVPVIAHVWKKKRMHREHLQMLIGGTMAAAVLLPLSIYMSNQGTDKPWYTPYKTFYEHTIQTHDQTPLTNHMGLRVIIGHKFFDIRSLRVTEEDVAHSKELKEAPKALGSWQSPIALARGKRSGQMQYAKDGRLQDPFEIWKKMRNERYKKYKKLAYTITALTMLLFFIIVRRVKSLWVAQCLGQIFLILGSQLTCYYYSFMILSAPLIKLRKPIEAGLFALAAITQIIWMRSYWNDNKYTLLTIVSLAFCYFMLGHFWRRTPKEDEYEDEPLDEDAATAT